MAKIRLLLVDDHKIVLEGLRYILEKDSQIEVLGYAQSKDETLAFLANRAVDIVLLDLSMPPSSRPNEFGTAKKPASPTEGMETAKAIRQLYLHTKIIFLTMIDDGNIVMEALNNGVHGFILKDKSADILLTAIHGVMEHNRYYSPDVLTKIESRSPAPNTSKPQTPLTQREEEIICLLATEPELTAEELAKKLNIGADTVRTHIRNAKGKLDFKKSSELVKFAIESRMCTRD